MENEKNIGKKVSANQKEILVSFLEENLDLARGRYGGIDANREMREKWNEVAELLNAAGGASKDGEPSRKSYVDLRLYVKNRGADLKAIANRSGVKGLGRQKPLTELEERIKNIISWSSVIGDECTVPESGLITVTNVDLK